MIELAFFGRSSDGSSVILTDGDGNRYSMTITDALRGAVRRVAPLGADESGARKAPLQPREIQALLRAGLSASEIAENENMSLSDITKYESPVLAERAWMIGRAQLCKIGDAPGTPILEDLVVNRLAARGVDADSLSWTAARKPEEDWEIYLTFIQGGVERQASWRLASDGNSVSAIDEEATWLTEAAEPPTPISAFFRSPTQAPAMDEVSSMEALIDQANAARGTVQPEMEAAEVAEIPDAEIASAQVATEAFISDLLPSAGLGPMDGTFAAESELSSPVPSSTEERALPSRKDVGYFEKRAAEEAPVGDEEAPSEAVLKLSQLPSESPNKPQSGTGLFDLPPGRDLPEEGETPTGKRATNRRSVPSWDEIVFGSKPE